MGPLDYDIERPQRRVYTDRQLHVSVLELVSRTSSKAAVAAVLTSTTWLPRGLVLTVQLAVDLYLLVWAEMISHLAFRSSACCCGPTAAWSLCTLTQSAMSARPRMCPTSCSTTWIIPGEGGADQLPCCCMLSWAALPSHTKHRNSACS